MIEIFEDFTVLVIETESRAIALDNQNGSKMVENTLGIYKTEFRVAPPQGIPAWMIVAGVSGGLVLFILTALVLAKVIIYVSEVSVLLQLLGIIIE